MWKNEGWEATAKDVVLWTGLWADARLCHGKIEKVKNRVLVAAAAVRQEGEEEEKEVKVFFVWHWHASRAH
jgi:hypothetical protein